MKEYREEAKRHHEAKLHKYGASHEERKACGGSMKRAHGGKVEHEDEKEDKSLIKKEVKSDCLKHRAEGGPISGGMGPKLGRGRKGKGKGTNVNVVVAGKGDGPSGPPMMPPPALGAGPSAMPPKPMAPPMPPPGAGAMPPRPGMPPMKRGGKVEHKHKESSHKAEQHRHHRKQHH